MDEYIKREEVFKAYEEVQRRSGLWRFETLINSVPASDVAPVVHGMWINQSDPDNNYNVTTTCSRCFHCDTHAAELKVPFCWFCGSKMDKEAEDAK